MKTMRRSVHPGPFLRTEISEGHGLLITETAGILGLSRRRLSALLNAKAAQHGDMALRFEKAIGVDMDTLIRMQGSYDIASTRNRAKWIQVRHYRPPTAGVRREGIPRDGQRVRLGEDGLGKGGGEVLSLT
ncbi:MAG: HigA family addiction module antidote protein [Bryobacteraceae bacterium]|nr:HigA family addiction module antidote protein [Bryobacteraceae bacterium]